MRLEKIILKTEGSGQNHRVIPLPDLIERTRELVEQHPEHRYVNQLVKEEGGPLRRQWKLWGLMMYGVQSLGRPIFEAGFPVSDRVMQGMNRLSTTEVFNIIDDRIDEDVVRAALEGHLPGRSARSILLHGADWIPYKEATPGDPDPEGLRAYNAQKSRKRKDFEKIRIENYLDRRYAHLADELGMKPSDVLIDGKIPPAGIARAKERLEQAFFAGRDISIRHPSDPEDRNATEIAYRLADRGSMAEQLADMLPDAITSDFIGNDVTEPDSEGTAQGGSLIGNLGERIVLWTLAMYRGHELGRDEMRPGYASVLRGPVSSLLTQFERDSVRIREETNVDEWQEEAPRRFADARVRVRNQHALVEIKTYPNQDYRPERVSDIIDKYRNATEWHDGKRINRKIAVLHTPNGSGKHAANLLEHAGWSVLGADDSLDGFRHAMQLLYEDPETEDFFLRTPFPIREEASLHRIAEMTVKQPFVFRTKVMRFYRQWAYDALNEKLRLFLRGKQEWGGFAEHVSPQVDFSDVTHEYPVSLGGDVSLDGTVFYDSELSGSGIGHSTSVHALVYERDGILRADAYFVLDPSLELEKLRQVRKVLESADRVVTMNGKTSDIPTLNRRLMAHRERPADINHIDLYGSWGHKLLEFEGGIGFQRFDDIGSLEAPGVYQAFLRGDVGSEEVDRLIRHCVYDAATLVPMYRMHQSGTLDSVTPIMPRKFNPELDEVPF